VRIQRDWQSIRAQAGLSLTELVVSITIASILMAIGVPSYRYVTYSNRVSTEINSLLGDMQYARSEAVKEGWMVTMCPALNTQYNACAGTSNWNNGWIIFSDVNSNQSVADPKYILRVRQAFTAQTQDTLASDSGLTFVTFNREGFATAFPVTNAGFVTFTLHTTPYNAQWARCLQLFPTGMMGTEKSTDPQGNCS
jgi:type IV fimbrial biogenesis protein FimT